MEALLKSLPFFLDADLCRRQPFRTGLRSPCAKFQPPRLRVWEGSASAAEQEARRRGVGQALRALCTPHLPGSSPSSGGPHPCYGLGCAKASGSPSPSASTPPYSAGSREGQVERGMAPPSCQCNREGAPQVSMSSGGEAAVYRSQRGVLEWERLDYSPRPVLLDALLVPSLADVHHIPLRTRAQAAGTPRFLSCSAGPELL